MTVQLKELFDRVVIDSGQFLLNSGELELNEDSFAKLCNTCLGIYSRFIPFHSMIYVDCSSTRFWDFTLENTKSDIFPHGRIPDNVFDCVPVRGAWILPSYYYQYYQFFNYRDHYSAQSASEIRQPFPYVYRKPRITLAISSISEVHTMYNHVLRPDLPAASQDGVTHYVCDTIDIVKDSLFIELLTSRFIKAIGKQRRAFTINEIALTTDAAQMASEGDMMEKEVMQKLTDNAKFYLAWG